MEYSFTHATPISIEGPTEPHPSGKDLTRSLKSGDTECGSRKNRKELNKGEENRCSPDSLPALPPCLRPFVILAASQALVGRGVAAKWDSRKNRKELNKGEENRRSPDLLPTLPPFLRPFAILEARQALVG
jgi:hypothetical protein